MVSSDAVFIVSDMESCLCPKLGNHVYDNNNYMIDLKNYIHKWLMKHLKNNMYKINKNKC